MTRPSPHPSYARLRLYRTYFRLTRADPAAHRFTVWWSDVEPCHWQVGVRDIDDAAAAQVNASWGGLSIAPPEVPALPEAVRALGEALVRRVLVVYPGAQDVKVRYEGFQRELAVCEVTPWTDTGSLGDRLIGTSRAVFVHADGEAELRPRPAGVMSLAATSAFSSLAACDEPPRWVDFLLPPEMEGRSLLTARELTGSVGPDLWRRFSAAVLRAADGAPAVLDDLLAAQGESVLPPGLVSEVELRLSGIGRCARQVSEDGVARFSLAEADQGEAKARWSSERVGVRVEATLSLGAGRVRLRVTSAAGATREAEGELLAQGPLLRDGPRVALRGGSLGVTFHPELRRPSGGECSFADDERFERVDVYFGSELHTART